MTKLELENYIRTDAKSNPDYTLTSANFSPYPFYDDETKETRFSMAYIVKFNHISEPKNHTTVLAFDGTEWFFWCGDAYVEKGSTKLTMKIARERVAEAMKSVKNEHDEAKERLDQLFNSEEKSTGCHFWKGWKTSGKICSHVKHLLNTIDDEKLKEIEEQFNHYTNVSKIKPSSSDSKKLQRYAFKKHVLFQGPRGFGKTYGVYDYLDSIEFPKENFFEVGGFEGMESVDLLGQNVPYVREIEAKKSFQLNQLKANNSFSSQKEKEHIQDLIWVDGALTAAFRNASKGIKTVLLIDELLRITSRELSILISSLTPDNKGFFTLRTRRIIGLDEDGCGIEEVIKVKKEHLWVVATTNIGSDYDIDVADLALLDRFIIIHKDANRTEVKTVVQENAKERKFSTSLVAKLMSFYDKMEKYKKSENIAHLVNTRHLSEMIELAIDENDVPEVIQDMILKWVDNDVDGKPDATQIKLIEKEIANIF
jgi:MoxR-like ATPase